MGIAGVFQQTSEGEGAKGYREGFFFLHTQRLPA